MRGRCRGIRIKMLQKVYRHAAGYVHAAAAEGQTADDPGTVCVGVLIGIRPDHPVDSEPAQAFQRDPDEPEQCGSEDSSIRDGEISCKHHRDPVCRGIRNAPSKEHVTDKDHDPCEEAELQ